MKSVDVEEAQARLAVEARSEAQAKLLEKLRSEVKVQIFEDRLRVGEQVGGSNENEYPRSLCCSCSPVCGDNSPSGAGATPSVAAGRSALTADTTPPSIQIGGVTDGTMIGTP